LSPEKGQNSSRREGFARASIYTEFTLAANVAMAASLSLVLGLITWLVLALARSAAGAGVAAAA
jgi:ABC-type sulfate transport system permease component